MTILFPSLSSPELEPFVAPFGRMMLAYGRAHEAVVELAMLEVCDEARARAFVQGTKELPKKMRRLMRKGLSQHHFNTMDRELKRYSVIAEERHHLIHGEWSFDVFDGGRLVIRRLFNGELIHTTNVTPRQLEEWAAALGEVGDALDTLEFAARREREGWA
jgi:hypothetical protein